MSEAREQLRTAELDGEVLSALSTYGDDYLKTIQELPEALTVAEIRYLGAAIFLNGRDFDDGKNKRNALIWNIGITSTNRGDLETAQNSAAVLREDHSFFAWIMLRRKIGSEEKKLAAA